MSDMLTTRLLSLVKMQAVASELLQNTKIPHFISKEKRPNPDLDFQ